MTTYFITICAHMQQNLFQRDAVAELLVATLTKYRDAGEFELHEYVVMPNHIHVLLSIRHQNLARVVQLIKGGFSHSLRQHGISVRAVWEQRYHDRRVRDENEFAELSYYIRQNPVRKGLAALAEDYPHSSANVSGLKPLGTNNSANDANLKVRSTGRTGAVAADDNGKVNLTVRSTEFLDDGDAGLKARPTSESDEKCIAIS